MATHNYRYSMWDGSQDVPDFSADDLLEKMADDLPRAGDPEQALRHLPRGCLAHRAVLGQGFGANTEQILLGFVAVGDQAAQKHRRRARHLGRHNDQPARRQPSHELPGERLYAAGHGWEVSSHHERARNHELPAVPVDGDHPRSVPVVSGAEVLHR